MTERDARRLRRKRADVSGEQARKPRRRMGRGHGSAVQPSLNFGDLDGEIARELPLAAQDRRRATDQPREDLSSHAIALS